MKGFDHTPGDPTRGSADFAQRDLLEIRSWRKSILTPKSLFELPHPAGRYPSDRSAKAGAKGVSNIDRAVRVDSGHLQFFKK